MKRFKLHLVIFLMALASIAPFVALDAETGHEQPQEILKPSVSAPAESGFKMAATETSLKPPAAVSQGAAPSSAAAARNAALRDELDWTFGGKKQRGWRIYEPLIARLIGTEHDAASAEFASALSRWQKSAGLGANGVLDGASLSAMVSRWQGARLKERGYPNPDQLLTAPPADFYDPGRAEDLRQVERETYAAYKRMVAAATQDPALRLKTNGAGELAPGEKYLKIISSFRSREYQEKLRREQPNAGRAALAVGNSPHFTGRALDLYVGGEPVETKDSNRALQVQTPAYRWLVRNAERFGFRPYYYEPWHWEYVSASK